MKFRTELDVARHPFLLDIEKSVILLGSCFSDNIGEKIGQSGWNALVNPFGVLYNPASILMMMQLAFTHRVTRRAIVEASIAEREGKFVSWFAGSKFASDTAEDTVDSLCEAIDCLEEALEKAGTIIITFGTPDVWLLKDSDRLVGNCHKFAPSTFDKRRLGIEEIASAWSSMMQMLKERNPDIKAIFTVSPRRYLGEGFADNSRLKAILLLAVARICDSAPDTSYFPAYEIMLDDLRDYRFYSRDMLHPSPEAIDYVWEKFGETYLDEKSLNTLTAKAKELRRSLHKPILSAGR